MFDAWWSDVDVDVDVVHIVRPSLWAFCLPPRSFQLILISFVYGQQFIQHQETKKPHHSDQRRVQYSLESYIIYRCHELFPLIQTENHSVWGETGSLETNKQDKTGGRSRRIIQKSYNKNSYENKRKQRRFGIDKGDETKIWAVCTML